MDKAKAYLEHIQKLLRDNAVPKLEGDLADDPLFRQIHYELTAIRTTACTFASGDFSSEIKIRGIIPGCFKALQAHLRHLAWQIKMVEKGEFNQEVRFMGDFSETFNSMVHSLHLNLTQLKRNEESLIKINDKLRKEVDRMGILKESEARFKFLANHDPLTGILNRRSFIEKAGVRLAKAAKRNIPCCLAMMDIDHFKDFNDTYGHPAGDEALRHVSRIIKDGLRKNDFVGRYGGEEFILFFYSADEETGMYVLERLRKNLAETPVYIETGPEIIYASFGLAGNFRENSGDKKYMQHLITDADTALYAAKMAGRNRVVLYNPEFKTRKQVTLSTFIAANPVS
jgi:diguanylate cyclase (GGDEF)-like protein